MQTYTHDAAASSESVGSQTPATEGSWVPFQPPRPTPLCWCTVSPPSTAWANRRTRRLSPRNIGAWPCRTSLIHRCCWAALYRQYAALSTEELWSRYYCLGGCHTKLELELYLDGAILPPVREHNLMALALNEHLRDMDLNCFVPFIAREESSYRDPVA